MYVVFQWRSLNCSNLLHSIHLECIFRIKTVTNKIITPAFFLLQQTSHLFTVNIIYPFFNNQECYRIMYTKLIWLYRTSPFKNKTEIKPPIETNVEIVSPSWTFRETKPHLDVVTLSEVVTTMCGQPHPGNNLYK